MSDVVWRELPRTWAGKPGVAKTYFVQKQPRKGYFTSINEAIAHAHPYERIEIAQGKYFENVVVSKPVELASEKGADRPEIYSHGVTVTVDAEEAHLDNLSIRTGDTESYALLIASGRASLFGCILQNVSVVGAAAPVLEKNKIIGSKTHGLYITGRAAGSYRGNTIDSHAWYCVWVESTGQPEFVTNSMQNGDQGQIIICGQAFDSGTAAYADQVSPIFKGNKITDTVQNALQKSSTTRKGSAAVRQVGDSVSVFVSEDTPKTDYTTDARVERFWKDRAAVVIKAHASPIFERNWIIDGINHGFRFHGGGGTITKNK
eukprot:gene19366-29823_t